MVHTEALSSRLVTGLVLESCCPLPLVLSAEPAGVLPLSAPPCTVPLLASRACHVPVLGALSSLIPVSILAPCTSHRVALVCILFPLPC